MSDFGFYQFSVSFTTASCKGLQFFRLFTNFQMFDWICHNRDVFLMNYVEIGRSYNLAKKLQDEHNEFTMISMVSS